MAVLPCPHKSGDVFWSRLRNSKSIILVSFSNGEVRKFEKGFNWQADNSLVIIKAKPNDSAMYFCNQSKICLRVTSDPSTVTSASPSSNGLCLDPGPVQTDVQLSSEPWKVLAGVVAGAALALLSVITLRVCWRKRSVENGAAEVVYEEPWAGCDVESAYSTICEPSSSFGPPEE